MTASNNYYANDELANILLKNGYVESSRDEMIKKGFVSPSKREFVLGRKKIGVNTPWIRFDHSTITEYSLQFIEDEIDANRLQALLAFHKLSTPTRYSIQTSFHPFSIHALLLYFQHALSNDYPHYYSKNRMERLKNAWQQVILN